MNCAHCGYQISKYNGPPNDEGAEYIHTKDGTVDGYYYCDNPIAAWGDRPRRSGIREPKVRHDRYAQPEFSQARLI